MKLLWLFIKLLNLYIFNFCLCFVIIVGLGLLYSGIILFFISGLLFLIVISLLFK